MAERTAAAEPALAPSWTVSRWFNGPPSLTLESLRGRVVVAYAFQMLCPGCALQALPQASRVHETFDAGSVAVIGLHTVFEHHEAMGPASLEAFIHEYRLAFPIGIDAPGEGGGMPVTMRRYAMRGTPTLLLIDREGRLRKQQFGHVDDLRLGAEIMALMRDQGPVQGPAGR
ncbi:MAG: TlpA disulfide reductase family protein [Alphaproteobacteria bacterium]